MAKNTPWKYQKCYPKGYQIGYDEIGELGYFHKKSDAVLAVKSVNCHKQLVEALGDAIKTFEPMCTVENCASWVIDDMKKAHAAASGKEAA